MRVYKISLIVFLMTLCACRTETEKSAEKAKLNVEEQSPLFSLLSPDSTSVRFINTLEEGPNLNVLMYEYLYNGGGVAVGDYNNDGFIDVYFSSNMGANALYLNQGKFKFNDATQTSGVQGRKGPWKTGVTSVDINADGKLDIYLCYSGALPENKRRNQLFVNQGNNEQGIPVFKEEAEKYGLDSPAFSNQAHFLDYDHDGDLDMLLLNHNPKSLPVLNEYSTKKLLATDDPYSGLRLYRNDKGKFVDITVASGINGSSLSYGLGLCISDLNQDGWEDFYVSNDYTIPDYLYLNNKNGTFSDHLKQAMGHTSHFSMGNNIADINNDGYFDVVTLDMLPEDNKRQKLLLSPDNYEKFDLNLRSGFHYQYMRNMLQLNNGDGTYSEIGQFAGISNTDWSWSALLADFDNDGLKDLYVTNGYFRDYTNLDFINYMEGFVQSKGRLKRQDVLNLIQKMPSTGLANYMYRNNSGISFTDITDTAGMGQIANSNGAAYADLDNDGDLDLVVNNINQPAFVYRNETDTEKSRFLKVKLKGPKKNPNGIGAKVSVYTKGKLQIQEQFTTRGYLSTVSNMLHFGFGETQQLDSVVVRWNDFTHQKMVGVALNQTLTLDHAHAQKELAGITKQQPTWFAHTQSLEANQPLPKAPNDFKRQPLLTERFSSQGSCLAKGDVNQDGLLDVFVGGVAGQNSRVYLQTGQGDFNEVMITDLVKDAAYEDTAAAFADFNQDGYMDLYVGSGGYGSLQPNDPALQDRLYLGDGKGGLLKQTTVSLPMATTTATLTVADFNADGLLDLFVGGRVVPGRYPEPPKSYVLINDGKGGFKDQTSGLAPDVVDFGMITDAIMADLDRDGQEELVVVGEWMPITVLRKNNQFWENVSDQFFETPYLGWWNTIEKGDLNRDGHIDLVVGNFGHNSQIKASPETPVSLIYADFDNNGSVDPILNYFIQGKNYPALTRDELLAQQVHLKSKFNSYESYAQAGLEDVLTPSEIENATKLEAHTLETFVFLGGEGRFSKAPLPEQAQFAPVTGIEILDVDQDGNQDLLLLGNKEGLKLRFGKIDANYGSLFRGDGKGQFDFVPFAKTGLRIKNQVNDHIRVKDKLVISQQNKDIQVFKLNKSL